MAGIDIRQLTNTQKVKNESEDSSKSIFAFLQRDIVLFKNGLNDKKKERFYSELKILFAAGVDLKTALELIVEEQTKDKEKQLFESIKQKVIEGASLSEAIHST